jgi:phosphatidylethanolamine/phosphatidyl-N-methylethanolamine N-methyltransferase
MPSIDRMRPQPDDRLAFFQGFLRKPMQVGSIIPSSRFLERRIARAAGIGRARLVVELGPGTGGTTRALLRQMRSDAKLLAIEIDPDFVSVLRRLNHDPRLIVHEGSATDVRQILAKHELGAPDVILSGIPFSTMTRPLGRDIIRSVHESLEPGGVFVAYQVRDRVKILGSEVFGRAQTDMVLLNVPPMRVYRWEKQAR